MDSQPVIISTSLEADLLSEKATCRLCRRQFAKYTCPTCNVPYCSLTCFRSQAHNQCSEGFYKKEIETDIHSGPNKSLQERQKMMELLKNFEEGASTQQEIQEEAQSDDDDDLAERLGKVDIESTSPEELWAMLTPAEQAKFRKVFNDPTSELAQKLLSSEQLEKEIQKPWWEDRDTKDEESEVKDQHGSRPPFMRIPESMVKPFPQGHPLIFNMCAICISYAYITRHLGASPLSKLERNDPDYYEAKRLITKMVPFLTDRKSTTVFPNLSAVITDIWSRFDIGSMTGDLFSLLLRDSSRLLKPSRITEVVPNVATEPAKMISPSHPHSSAVLVLSDCHEIFASSKSDPNLSKSQQIADSHTCHKTLYYAAHILATPSAITDGVAHEMDMRAQGYQMQENVSGKLGLDRGLRTAV